MNDAFAPGCIDTPMGADEIEPAAMAEFLKHQPIGRHRAAPRKSPHAVLWLCSPAASYRAQRRAAGRRRVHDTLIGRKTKRAEVRP